MGAMGRMRAAQRLPPPTSARGRARLAGTDCPAATEPILPLARRDRNPDPGVGWARER
jgi:hypothetical protein